MEFIVANDYDAMSRVGADIVGAVIREKPACVLGLATGSTPIGMYKELIKDNENGLISFSDVTTYNLDEYCSLNENDPQSYRYFMNENLFNHVDIDKSKTHVPSGLNVDESYCVAYDKAIADSGGIDIQVLGLGHNGHIGFNEPNTYFQKDTHVVELDESTIDANSRFFDDIEDVPRHAITMGIGTIFNARKIIVLVSGEDKAEIVAKAFTGRVEPEVPASILQFHPDVCIVLDEKAASKLHI